MGGCVVYPLRAVWRINDERTTGDVIQFMITVPKKKLRHAVDRVTMRRRIRESYRLHRHEHEALPQKVDLAFIYLADTLLPYHAVEKSTVKILEKLHLSHNIPAEAESQDDERR